MRPDGKFMHRPISVTVEEVSEMDTVRTMPAEETFVAVNLKFDRRRAWSMVKNLLDQLLVEEEKMVDLVTLTVKGKLK
jgi:hypothetical protein